MVLSFPPKGKRALLPESFRDAKSICPENVVDFQRRSAFVVKSRLS